MVIIVHFLCENRNYTESGVIISRDKEESNMTTEIEILPCLPSKLISDEPVAVVLAADLVKPCRVPEIAVYERNYPGNAHCLHLYPKLSLKNLFLSGMCCSFVKLNTIL